MREFDDAYEQMARFNKERTDYYKQVVAQELQMKMRRAIYLAQDCGDAKLAMLLVECARFPIDDFNVQFVGLLHKSGYHVEVKNPPVFYNGNTGNFDIHMDELKVTIRKTVLSI